MPRFPIDNFFAEGSLADPATYTDPSAVDSAISVIFDREYIASGPGAVAVADRQPAATCREQDVAGATVASRLNVHGELLDEDGSVLVDTAGQPLVGDGVQGKYYVTAVEPDGTGIAVLRLSEDPGT